MQKESIDYRFLISIALIWVLLSVIDSFRIISKLFTGNFHLFLKLRTDKIK